MEYKAFHSVNKISGRTVTGIAAVFGNIDAYNDRIHPGAFTKTINENMRRVRFLWQHDATQPPIARIDAVREVSKDELPDALRVADGVIGGLEVTRTYLETPRAEEVLIALRDGAIGEMSIGYTPIKMDYREERIDGEKVLVRNLREVRLWDISDVVWGANDLTTAVKAVVPYKETGKVSDLEAAWERPNLSDFTDGVFEDLSTAERRRIMDHFAWSETIPPERYDQLKLPHHRPSRNGVGPVVWNGVRAAMAALMGARGGADIPADEVEGVYRHLSRHYEEFGKEPPQLKSVWACYWLTQVDLAHYAEKADLIKDVLGLLRAEPRDPSDWALTQRLMMRLKILEREI